MRRRAVLLGSVGLASLGLSNASWLSGLARAQDLAEDREPRDPRAMSPEERLHVPVLVLPERVRAARPFDLVVQVGVSPHPMVVAHHVDRIEVLFGDRRAFVCELGPSVGYPVVRIPLVLEASASLVVRARCTLHGTWRTRRELTVG